MPRRPIHGLLGQSPLSFSGLVFPLLAEFSNQLQRENMGSLLRPPVPMCCWSFFHMEVMLVFGAPPFTGKAVNPRHFQNWHFPIKGGSDVRRSFGVAQLLLTSMGQQLHTSVPLISDYRLDAWMFDACKTANYWSTKTNHIRIQNAWLPEGAYGIGKPQFWWSAGTVTGYRR